MHFLKRGFRNIDKGILQKKYFIFSSPFEKTYFCAFHRSSYRIFHLSVKSYLLIFSWNSIAGNSNFSGGQVWTIILLSVVSTHQNEFTIWRQIWTSLKLWKTIIAKFDCFEQWDIRMSQFMNESRWDVSKRQDL